MPRSKASKAVPSSEVPAFMAANEFIKRGYRVNYSVRKLVASLFSWHNQTVNVWSHLLPALVIFALLLSSNLYIEMYHEKGEILAFVPKFETQLNKIASYQAANLTQQIEQNIPNQVLGTLIEHYLTPLSSLTSDVEQLLQLTQEDNVITKQKVYQRLAKIQQIRGELDGLAMYLSNQAKNRTINSTEPVAKKLEFYQDRLTIFVDDIIKATQKIASQVSPIPKWPILVFLVTMSFCLASSSTYHLMYPFSYRAYKLLSNLDFAGVIIFTVGSSYPALIYGSQCHGIYGTVIYLPFITVLGVALFTALSLGYFRGRQNRHVRNLVFSVFSFFYFLPMGHALVLENFYDNLGDPLHFSEFLLRYLSLAPIYLSGVLIMTYKCPERYSPGTFDICGASHQLWHLCVVAGMAITYYTNWDYYYRRRVCPCPVL